MSYLHLKKIYIFILLENYSLLGLESFVTGFFCCVSPRPLTPLWHALITKLQAVSFVVSYLYTINVFLSMCAVCLRF